MGRLKSPRTRIAPRCCELRTRLKKEKRCSSFALSARMAVTRRSSIATSAAAGLKVQGSRVQGSRVERCSLRVLSGILWFARFQEFEFLGHFPGFLKTDTALRFSFFHPALGQV